MPTGARSSRLDLSGSASAWTAHPRNPAPTVHEQKHETLQLPRRTCNFLASQRLAAAIRTRIRILQRLFSRFRSIMARAALIALLIAATAVHCALAGRLLGETASAATKLSTSSSAAPAPAPATAGVKPPGCSTWTNDEVCVLIATSTRCSVRHAHSTFLGSLLSPAPIPSAPRPRGATADRDPH